MKKLEMNNYESPLFKVYEIQVKKAVLGGSDGYSNSSDVDGDNDLGEI